MPETTTKHVNNSILLKIIIGLLSISGTLMSFIGLGVISAVKDLQKDVQALTPISATHTTQIGTLIADVSTMKIDIKELNDFKSSFTALYALKPDDIVVRRRRRQ